MHTRYKKTEANFEPILSPPSPTLVMEAVRERNQARGRSGAQTNRMETEPPRGEDRYWDLMFKIGVQVEPQEFRKELLEVVNDHRKVSTYPSTTHTGLHVENEYLKNEVRMAVMGLRIRAWRPVDCSYPFHADCETQSGVQCGSASKRGPLATAAP